MATTTYTQRLQALDFRDLPEGHYAVPVWEFTDAEDEDTEPPLLGYRTYQRTAAHTTRNGRRRGRDSFITGTLIPAPGIDPERLTQAVRHDSAAAIELWGPRGDVQSALEDLLRDVQRGDTYRATFGQITGRCGHCGRELTDPTSKLLGIGPDCRGDRGQRRAESLPDTPLTEQPAETPLRHWAAMTAPEPGMKRTARKNVYYLPAGHGVSAYRPEGEVCNSIFDRARGGDHSRCPTPSVWKVSVTRGRRTASRYWCDTHLPGADRPADAPEPANSLF